MYMYVYIYIYIYIYIIHIYKYINIFYCFFVSFGGMLIALFLLPAHVVISFVSSEILTCRLLKWLLDHPMSTAKTYTYTPIIWNTNYLESGPPGSDDGGLVLYY